MQISKVHIIASLATAVALQLHAQPASPELQNKALDLLRQTISHPQQSGATTSPAVPVAPPLDIPKPGPARPDMPASPQMGKSATAEQQQQALGLLRQELAREQSAMPARQTNPAKSAGSSGKIQPPGKSGAAASQTPSSSVGSAATSPTPMPAPGSPEQAGPKSKQQRLMDLLELYKADKLTPAEYHAQRAKILSEP
jgi:hypothetical protein